MMDGLVLRFDIILKGFGAIVLVILTNYCFTRWYLSFILKLVI